jgi:hypothetical protein
VEPHRALWAAPPTKAQGFLKEKKIKILPPNFLFLFLFLILTPKLKGWLHPYCIKGDCWSPHPFCLFLFPYCFIVILSNYYKEKSRKESPMANGQWPID